MLNMISNWRRERTAVSQLSRLSDRELADLGIQRQDIKSVAHFASTVTRDEVAASAEPPLVLVDRAAGRRIEPVITAFGPTSLAA